VAFGRVGFCNDELNAEGPVQLYVPPGTAGVVKLIVLPVQTGELLPGAGADGIGLITAVVVPNVLVQPFSVTVTEYVPAFDEVAPVILGF